MALQKQVYTSKALGVPGAKATPVQSVYQAINYVVADDAGIAAGGFAFRSSNEDYEFGATAEGGSSDTLLGFVERVINYPIYDVAAGGTLVIPKNYPLTIAVHGDYYAKAPATVAVGDAVTCDETGAIVDGGSIDTGWIYKTAGDEGDDVIISSWVIGGGSSSGSNPD